MMKISAHTHSKPGRGCGKRHKNGTVEFGFVCPPEMAAAIIAHAEKYKCSTSEAIRTLIDWGLESAKAETA